MNYLLHGISVGCLINAATIAALLRTVLHDPSSF